MPFCLIKFKLRLLLRHLTACAHKLRHNTAALFLFRLVRRRIFELFTELFAAAGGQKLIYENNRISHIVAHICVCILEHNRVVIHLAENRHGNKALCVICAVFIYVVKYSEKLCHILLYAETNGVHNIGISVLGKEGVGQELAVLLKILLVIRLEVGVQSGKAVCESVAVIRRSSVFNSGF